MKVQEKSTKRGRPRLAKGEAKEQIVPVRFDADDLKLITMAATSSKKTVSEWIRVACRTAAEESMFRSTLHGAMRSVLLRRSDYEGTTSFIAEEIAKSGTYKRKDGAAASASQVNARARKHPDLFEFTAPGILRLVKKLG